MNKLTYSRRNDTYNGKVQFDTLTTNIRKMLMKSSPLM